MSAIAYEQRPSLVGWHFRLERHDCEWTVTGSARGGNWVCREPKFGTVCQFHFTEIIANAVPPWAPIEIEREKSEQKQSGEYRAEDWDE